MDKLLILLPLLVLVAGGTLLNRNTTPIKTNTAAAIVIRVPFSELIFGENIF
jgi:hypothetical protein